MCGLLEWTKHRLHALCPYFAMFPPDFARDSILQYSEPGDVLLDPFSGRGTLLLEALLNEREALACDINPVAYCVSAAKADVPSLPSILDAIDILEHAFYRSPSPQHRSLPLFFSRAFHATTLNQILFLRSNLEWKRNNVHRFLCALTLGHLHGETDRSTFYLSNQMPHSISTKPAYSVKYWEDRDLWPPERDAFQILRDRAKYRLRDAAPLRKGSVALNDARNAARSFANHLGTVSCVVTSPPYLYATNYAEDQWLRLWFLGGPPQPTYGMVSKDDRHNSFKRYWKFLADVWRGIQPLMRANATLVCRIGAKGLSDDEISSSLSDSLREVWPKVHLVAPPKRTELRNSQTTNLVRNAKGCKYEIDFAYSLPC